MNGKLIMLRKRIKRVGNESLIKAKKQPAKSCNHAYDVDDGFISACLSFVVCNLSHAISFSPELINPAIALRARRFFG
jgi:hypothetical protein